jgi:hypothetical protein
MMMSMNMRISWVTKEQIPGASGLLGFCSNQLARADWLSNLTVIFTDALRLL